MSDAERQRRHRARKRKRLAVYHVEIGEHVFDGLEAAGLVTMDAADDRAAVERALGIALRGWADAQKSSRVTPGVPWRGYEPGSQRS